jgi:lysozyme family protein
MRTNFELSLKFVLEDEGGNDDDPVDRGGRTSRGITQREYDAWCALHKSPAGDVWKASNETIHNIYFQQYWLPNCDPLPIGTDYVLFDCSVLFGPHRATIFMQEAVDVSADGHFGVVTMQAVMAANPKILIESVTEKREAFYKEIERSNPSQKRFDKGWMNRAAAVKTRALSMLSRTVTA